MSYDIQLQNYCDHKIIWARAQLEADTQTVYFQYPLAAVSSLKVRLNGVIQAPTTYSVKTERESLSLIIISRLTFLNKVKHHDPIIEFFYTTFPDNCPKCLGVRTVDDWVINGNGDIGMIDKEHLLLQEVEKIIVTKISTNPFHNWYGTELHSLIGTKIFDRTLLQNRVREQVNSAIEKLRNTQRQMQASGRNYSPGELFGKLLKIDIQDTDDPAMIQVIVTFTSQSNMNMEYTQYISMNETTRLRLVN
jgi:hypothetical protein